MRKTALLLACVALAVLVVCGVAWADTFTVNNTKNSGPGSLRTAIIRANENPGRDVITFAPSARGEIRLKGALPTLTGELEVRGPGAGALTVRRAADRAFRIFTVAESSVVRITGLRISNGLADGPGDFSFNDDYGGGVRNDGTLALRGVVVSSSRAAEDGGGVYNADGATLTVENSILLSNRAASPGLGGGAIFNFGTLTVTNSTFNRNTAFAGGAIINHGAEATVEGSTFSANRARIGAAIDTGSFTRNSGFLKVTDSTFTENTAASNGCAIYQNRFGPVTVESSTFTRNSSGSGMGGAIAGFRGSIKVTDSTFTDNTAGTDGGAIVVTRGGMLVVLGSTFVANSALDHGGGISSYRNTTTISNSTFAKNSASKGGGLRYLGDSSRLLSLWSVTFASNEATESGGGVYAELSRGDVAAARLRATIVAGNEAPEGPDAFGPFDSRGYNLIGDPSGSSGFGGTDLTNTRAGLDPEGLKDNGGPTKTIALVRSSPAIDAVAQGCPPPATDQRGVSRPQNGDGEGEALCDIGAFERSAPSSSQ